MPVRGDAGASSSVVSFDQDEIWEDLSQRAQNNPSAGNEVEQPAFYPEADQPAGEREPEAPTIDELVSKMKVVLRRGHRKLSSDVLKKIKEDRILG